MKRLLLVSLLLVVPVLGAAVPTGRPHVHEEVYTRRLFLVDAKGHVRATMMTSDDARDSVALTLLTPDGRALVALSLLGNGDAHIGIDDRRGTRAQLVLAGGGGGVVVYDGEGRPVHRLISER